MFALAIYSSSLAPASGLLMLRLTYPAQTSTSNWSCPKPAKVPLPIDSVSFTGDDWIIIPLASVRHGSRSAALVHL